MKSLFSCLLLLLATLSLMSQSRRLYMIPGFGADARSFQYLALPPGTEPIYIEYLPIMRHETMEAYAHRLATQIDTTQPFSLLGVSMGGMLAIEISQFLHPEQVIIVASAKTEDEVAFRYHLMRYLPLHKIIGDRITRTLSPIGRRLFEPEGQPWEPLYRQMIRDKPRHFLTRSVHMISRWKNDTFPAGLIHIHGKIDHTLPFRNIRNPDYVIAHGGHMMIISCAGEISQILASVLK
ncbi:MAG: alpha/beta hydrolase family protein [Bacteroidia bacterium]|nr:alpha/beta hydrolase family protein [Bacteroidia bacterium]